MVHSSCSRILGLALVIVLAVTLATPAKAEADPLTTITLVSLGVAGVLIIAYLIIANTVERRADEGRIIRVACVGDGCRVLLVSSAVAAPHVELEAP